jgi:hypothetical protein
MCGILLYTCLLHKTSMYFILVDLVVLAMGARLITHITEIFFDTRYLLWNSRVVRCSQTRIKIILNIQQALMEIMVPVRVHISCLIPRHHLDIYILNATEEIRFGVSECHKMVI